MYFSLLRKTLKDFNSNSIRNIKDDYEHNQVKMSTIKMFDGLKLNCMQVDK